MSSHIEQVNPSNAKWQCSGCDGLCSLLTPSDSMMRNLNATVGQVQQELGGQKTVDSDYFVATEKEAGRGDDYGVR